MTKEQPTLDEYLNALVEDNGKLSTNQIIDKMVSRVTHLLDQQNIKELDRDGLKGSVEKWIPRESIKNESPLEFIIRVYGNIRGINMGDIRYTDETLYSAYREWCKRLKKEGNELPYNPIPMKKDLGINEVSSYQYYVYRRVMALKNKDFNS